MLCCNGWQDAGQCRRVARESRQIAEAERIAFESLHVLGCVDVGEPDGPGLEAFEVNAAESKLAFDDGWKLMKHFLGA